MEAKSNVLSGTWLSIATNTAGPSGILVFFDPASIHSPQRFYRARLRD
jgi:hypothetical protein